MNNFIIFEGPDFSGKTTILKRIALEYDQNPIAFCTREPGSFLSPSSLICELYRKKLLEKNNSPLQEAELFAKSRFYHTKDIITRLKINNVICDRYILSSLAYQGYAQELGKDIIYELNKSSLDLLQEANVKMNIIKFNISEDEWRNRKNKRMKEQELDKIETKNLDKKILDFYSHKYIYEYYTDQLNANHFDINANLSVDEICSNVIKIIKNL